MQPPSEDMYRTFTDFKGFRQAFNPNATGVDFRNFCSTVQSDQRNFDSNISNALEHNRRVIAYKQKE
jgi:hypothetical protein